MTTPLLTPSLVTAEQKRLLDQLAALVDAEQARWLSGYFAGFAAGMAREMPHAGPEAPTSRRLLVLYGSETGNSREIAQRFHKEAAAKGLSPTLADMSDYKQRQLAQEQDIVIVVSTYGEGDPPQPAVGFFEFLEGRKAPKLADARFAVLALGDSSYERYCEAGKRLDRRFEELGATRIAPRVDCDIDYDEPAEAWAAELLGKLAAAPAGVSAASPAQKPGAPGVASYDKRAPFAAAVIENSVIVGRGSSKETRHIELSLEGSGLVHEPGDALGIVAENAPETVRLLLDALGFSADAPVKHKDADVALAELLRQRFEITTATPRFLEAWAALSGAEELTRLLVDDCRAERAAFLHRHHVIDIVRRYPVSGLTPQDFIAGLRPLQPRLYSIASSAAFAPDEAHLTVSPVRYDLHGEARAGVASDQLASRSPAGAHLPVYIQSNPHFRLPADDTPIVMIGAGTGVAPYRAFMQEREARGAAGKSWLFFGERRFRTDFLYQTEWQTFLKDGALTRMDVAFSRDGAEKVYVQHRMREQARDLYAWLEEGAHVYVCGDAEHLAPDVNEALIGIVAAEARLGRESAEDYVRALAAGHRYQRDVY